MDVIFTHRKIVQRIDTNKDGYVSHAELHYWIKHRQRRYIEENVNKHWKDYDTNQDGKISWEEYKNTTYGYYLGNIIWDMHTSYVTFFSPMEAFSTFNIFLISCRLKT